MAITLSGDSPNLTSASLTTPTLTSPTFAGTPSGSIITSGTAVASTSGTSIDFTSIPSWVKRVTVNFSGVSISGTSQFLIQLGTSGGVVSTGYAGAGTRYGASTMAAANSTAGCFFANVTATTYSGSIVFTNTSNNLWTWAGQLGTPSATEMGNMTAGGVNLGGVLTRVRITTVNGTDTYTAGSINILYE